MLIRCLLLLLATGAVATAAPRAKIRTRTLPTVVQPAPDFTFAGIGKPRSLRSLKGQPVVLVIADSDRTGLFRKQVKGLRPIYQQFASRQVVFIAALKESTGPVRSDIPFAMATNGAAVASAYGVDGSFTLVVIGRDGNVDYQTDRVRTPERVRDVIQNALPVQAAARRQ